MTPEKQPTSQQSASFVKGLGLTSATTLVMGSMIGSGIFIVSSDVARQVKSPGLLILCWLIGAALTIIAALSYGELAAAMPHAGGQYVYLREAFGRLWGFLYGWTLFVVIQTGTIAAVAVAFAKYAGVFLPSVSAGNYLHRFRANSASPPNSSSPSPSSCTPHPRQHARHPHRRAGAERLHIREGGIAPRTGRPRLPAGPQPAGHRRQLSRFLAQRQLELGHCRPRRIRYGRPTLLLRRVEQRYLHRRRSPQSETQPAALARLRRRRRYPSSI